MKTKTNENVKSIYRILGNFIVTAIMIWQYIMVWDKSLVFMMDHEFQWRGRLLMFGIYAALVIVFTYAFEGYKMGINKIGNVVLSQILALVAANVIALAIIILMVGSSFSVGKILLDFGGMFLQQLIKDVILTVIIIFVYEHIFSPYSVLVISGEHQNNLKQKMSMRGDTYIIDGEISCKESMSVIAQEISKYDAVLVNDVPSESRNKILKMCFDQSKRVYFTPKISDIFVRSSEEINMFDTPLYLCKNMGLAPWQRFVKRGMDIVISLVGILLTSPIMLVTALAIKLYDQGPVFYKQTRCTINGKEFQIMKFRSMIVDAEKDGRARLATEHDSRITPVGRFIRATRIDELPQFFNILFGDMSMVGPRPERPEINEQYCKAVPEFAYRLRVKAGLTGYAQVHGKYNTSSYDKLKLDLIYVEKCSILLDIQLLLQTMKVVLQKEATEGVAEGQFTADVSAQTEQKEEAKERDHEESNDSDHNSVP